ncbi:MAG: zinc ribbon domain-containing protein [Candidatus Aquicultor sp.]|nr:zinc ribbon domain-containing protein [Candidatus Aquicultor sp.]
MPIYGYRCQSCEHTFEVTQSINDEPIKDCPECSGQVRKLFYPVGIAFKGSGFHVNDYKSPGRVAKEKSAGDNGSSSTCKPGGDSSSCSSCATATASNDN